MPRLRFACRACGTVGPTVECDVCQHDGGVSARLAELMSRGAGQGKYLGARRRRWWHLPARGDVK